MKTSGKVEPAPGGTPAGGVAFVSYFFGADGEPLPDDAGAVAVEVHELDEAGASIQRTYARLDPEER